MNKCICIILLLFSMFHMAYGSYIIDSEMIDSEKYLESYNNIDKFVAAYGVEARIGNESIFLDDKFAGRYPFPIHLAVIFNDNERLKKYIGMGADVNRELEYPGMTPLILAVKNNNKEAVKILLSAGADAGYETIRFNLSAIDFASDYEIANMLILKGVKVNKINSYDYLTPLHKAVLLKDKKLIALYLPKSNMYQKDFFSYKDAFYYAVALRDIDIINMFIDNGYKLSYKEYENIKLSTSNSSIINLLSKIVDNNKKNETILPEKYKADKEILKQRIYNSDIIKKYPEIKENPYEYIYLFKEYKTKEIPDYIEYAAMYQYDNFENLVYKNKSADYLRNAKEFYENIFTRAVAEDNQFLVKTMFYAGYNDEVKYGINSAVAAIYKNNFDMLKLLVKMRYDIDNCYPPVYETGSFHYQCYHLLEDMLQEPYISGDVGRFEYVYPEIDESETVMIYDEKTDTTISQSKAVLYNMKRIVDDYSREYDRTLSLYNDNLYNSNSYSKSSLKKPDIIMEDIANGKDALDNHKSHALLVVANDDYKEILDTLLDIGVNMYIGDNESSVFHFAGNPELLKVFLKYNLNVNVRAVNDKPLLFEAVSTKSLESVKLLVENGANLDDLFRGTSILSFSSAYGSKEITKYLQSKISEKGMKFQPDNLMEFFEKNKKDEKTALFMTIYKDERLDKIYEQSKDEYAEKILYKQSRDFTGNIACLAGEIGYYELVKMFIEKGAAINTVCSSAYHALIDPSAFMLADNDIKLYEKYSDAITLKETKYSSALYGVNEALNHDKNDFKAGNQVLEYLFKKQIFSDDDKILVSLLMYSKGFEEIFKYINIENYDSWNMEDAQKFGIKPIQTANPLKAAINALNVEQVKILLKHNIVVQGKEDLLAYVKSYDLSDSDSRKSKNNLKKITALLEDYCQTKD